MNHEIHVAKLLVGQACIPKAVSSNQYNHIATCMAVKVDVTCHMC